MGQEKVSRKKFFESLRSNQKNIAADKLSAAEFGTEDPLFEKYSRKKLTPRVYSTEEVTYKQARINQDTLRVGNVTSGLAPYTGVWNEQEVLHLLRRTGFGYTKAKVDALLALSPSVALDNILNIDINPPAPPVNWYENTFHDPNNVPYGATWIDSFFPAYSAEANTANSRRTDAMRRWLFGLALNDNNTIREKMVWFWYHFIPFDFDDVRNSSNANIGTNSSRVHYMYFRLLRENVLGNFKTLIKKISTEPAMMYYLNNQKNSRTAPDENFARELMELFTLGKPPTADVQYYSQADIVEAAKVLTGWRVQDLNTANVVTSFVSGQHHQGNKQFSGFFNNTRIDYQAGDAGANELDLLLDMIFSKSKIVSEYICRRLYRYFVYYDIDANIEANVIVPLAQTFVANNWDILPVLKQLFKSEHFFDPANKGVFIKTPYDLVIGSNRIFNTNFNVADPTNHEAQYRVWNTFNSNYCLSMEQEMGSIPNVSGWTPFYQVPKFHQFWINSNTIQKRYKFLEELFNGYNQNYNGLNTRIQAMVIPFAQQFGNTIAADPNQLVATCIKYLLPVDLSAQKQGEMKLQTLLTGQTNDGYWTAAWNNYITNPNTTNTNVVTSRLKSLLVTIVRLAEFQLH